MNNPVSKPFLLVEQKRLEAILKNKNTTTFWEEKKKAHEEVQTSLDHYATKLQERIMVPIGKRGLMKGRIVNTNQVFVSLGGGWFIKVCSSEAQKICARRISECNEMLEKLEKERKLLEGWTALSNKQVFAMEGSQEIIEPYNEQEEGNWRKKHAEKVKEHKKKLAEVREQLEDSRGKDRKSEDQLWKHLELLELQEEFEDELNRLDKNSGSDEESESDKETLSPLDSDDDSHPEEEEKESQFNKNLILKDKRINEENKIKNISVKEQNNHKLVTDQSSSIKKSILSKDNKTSLAGKKVTFANADDDSEKGDHISDSRNTSVRQRETITLGQVIEHSFDSNKYQRNSEESRPLSKFRSSKLASKK